MIPLIRSEVVSHGWTGTEELINFIAVSESTPGPFAVNIATFVGRTAGGIPGAFCATFGVVLPSFLIILILAGFYEKFRKSKLVQGAMSGLRPAVIGLIAAALYALGKEVLLPKGASGGIPSLISLLIFALMAVLAFKKKNPILIISVSGIIGIITGFSLGL